MNKNIFVNLPVKNLEKSKEFFAKLGYGFNLQFTNDDAACMVISDDIFVMLLMEPFFKTFTKKELADAHTTTEVLLALNEASREAVDAHLEKALAAGATEAREAKDYGFMYQRAYSDLDGHIWEILWMDQGALDGQSAS